MTPARRPLAGVDLVAALYATGYVAWMLARWLGLGLPNVANLAFFPLGLAVAWANWRNSRVATLDRRTRLAWRLLALSAVMLWGTGNVWTLSLVAADTYRYPVWIDQLTYWRYFILVAAFLAFPARRFSRDSLTRFRLDAALVVVAGFILAFYFGFRLLFTDPTGSIGESLFSSSLDWAVFATAGIGFLNKRDAEARQALLLRFGASLSFMLANSILWGLADYHAGDPVDALWFLAWALRWIAARQAWHGYAVHRPAAPGEAAPRVYQSGWFSYAMVGGALGLMLSRIVADDHDYLGVVAVAAMVMGGLLVLRQFVEINENRRLFREQVARESRFRSVVQNSSDVVLVLDREGVVSYASPSVARVFGEGARIEIGTALRELLPPEDAALASSLLTGEPPVAPQFETRLLVGPGKWCEVEMAWTDLRPVPSVGGIVISCRNVTDRHEYERYLRQAQELDAVSHLAGGLAHDLNNLLTVIRGYAELLRSEWPDQSPLSADLDQVVAAVDRAASMTAKILAFSRRQPVHRRRLDVNAVIEGVEPMLAHIAREPVEVRYELGSAPWPVVADQGQLEQVVVNLVSNARDAMPHGGEIQVATANRRVAAEDAGAQGVPPGDYVALSVADRGSGVEPELREKIFEPFFTTKPAGQGLGLGLTVVRGIATDADGHVLLTDREGGGSVVTVLLPRAEGE